jgi:hypothetical protein
MQCTRCAGLRVTEIIYEGGGRIPALRCIHCGDVSDQVIALNRQRHSHQKPRRARMHIYKSKRWKEKSPHYGLTLTGQDVDSTGRQVGVKSIPVL